MLTPKPGPEIKAVVVLKTGQKFDVLFGANRQFYASSLTAETIHGFRTVRGEQVFVQGDNIAFIRVEANA